MGVTITGLAATMRKLVGLPKRVDVSLVDLIEKETRPMPTEMRVTASGYGRQAARAAGTVAVRPVPKGAEVKGGATGSALGHTVLQGAEYGGQRRVRTYVTRSRKGTPYIVRRRTTMQFKPWLGSRGYWYWPTVRRELRGINDRAQRALREAIEGD